MTLESLRRVKKIATGKLSAASCYQIISSSTSNAAKKVHALFVILKCRWL